MAEANLPAARSRAERLKGLVEIHAVGQQDYDDAAAALLRAEASVASARAAVESARINLAYTPLKAPISGRTGKSAVTSGALVTAYQPVPLVTIQQLDPIYVDVTQSSADLLRLRRNLESGQLKRAGAVESQVKLAARGRHALPARREAPVPRRHGGPDDRLGRPAHGLPEPRRTSCCPACSCGRSSRRA